MDSIDHRPIWEQAYTILRKQILDGHLAPGTLLNLRELAAQLSISVTPVRDAVLRLIAEGFIENSSNRDLHVTQLSIIEVEQTLGLRILLETYALEQSAAKLTPDDFDKLAELLAAAEKVIQEPSEATGRNYAELGRTFHHLLVAAAGNKPLLDLYNRLHPQAFLVIERVLHGFQPDRNKEDHLEHIAVFEALRRHDYTEAVVLLKQHLEQVRSYALDVYQKQS